MNLSVVITVLNEEKSILPLVQEIRSLISPLGLQWELVFVDDGSSDGSAEAIRSACEGLSMQLVQFEKNRGKSAALCAGFEKAQGEIILTMDADLQNDPQDAVSFMTKINEGYDFVNGWRQERRDSFHRKIMSSVSNSLISLVTGVQSRDLGCGFKAYRRHVAKGLRLFRGGHRFIHVIVQRNGFRMAEMPVHHRPRVFGHSKYRMRFFEVLRGLIKIQRRDPKKLWVPA